MAAEPLILTASGVSINPLDPAPPDIRIEDIAHHLANQTRFTGATRKYYSVAQHCVIVSQEVDRQFALWGLLHDGAEYLLQDVVRPLKQDEYYGKAYRGAEARAMKAIAEQFGLRMPQPPEVKEADRLVLRTEFRDLFPAKHLRDACLVDKNLAAALDHCRPMSTKIVPWTPQRARREFLDRYHAIQEVSK